MTDDLSHVHRTRLCFHKCYLQHAKILLMAVPVEDVNPEIQSLRITRVTFGVNSSVFLLTGTIHSHLKKYEEEDRETIKEIKESLYVDDLTSGAENEEKGLELYRKSKQIFQDAGFNLRKWTSNSKGLLDRIEKEEGDQFVERRDSRIGEIQKYSERLNPTNQVMRKEEQKILGVIWNLVEDKFCFRFDELCEVAARLPYTKRSVLQVTASIYDPLGLVSPILVEMKILFQKLCVSHRSWDEELDEKSKREWFKWLTALSRAKIDIDRCYLRFESKVRKLELVGFGDASMKAYAAVVYIRSEMWNAKVNVEIVAAKTRVAPAVKQTLPRLELLAAVILARLIVKVQKSLSTVKMLDKMTCFTDSKVVLNWIKRKDRKYKQFVENRSREIREITDEQNWYHVSGKSNPADVGSRGCPPDKLSNMIMWFEDPEWLKQSKELWPEEVDLDEDKEWMEEIPVADKRKFEETEVNLIISEENQGLCKVVDISRFSNLKKLLLCTAMVFRFIDNCRSKKIAGYITVDELEGAHNEWIKQVQ